MLLTGCLLFLMAAPASRGDIPPYFIKLIQERTLFANDESITLVVRLGNQVERSLKSKKFPDILQALKVKSGDRVLSIDPKLNSKALYRKVNTLGYGEHRDFRLNLARFFPEMRAGGVFHVSYQDKNYNFEAKSISVAALPLPDLNTHFVLDTSLGKITIALDEVAAPNHVRNFAILTALRFYEDMIFHRVAAEFVIQTGDPLGNGQGGSGYSLNLEKSPLLKHDKYAVGMARAEASDSATSQFYICLKSSPELDKGYTVFGKVVAGFEVVDAIGRVATTGSNGDPPNKPLEDVKLKSIEAVAPTP